jgi:hypothetical protein
MEKTAAVTLEMRSPHLPVLHLLQVPYLTPKLLLLALQRSALVVGHISLLRYVEISFWHKYSPLFSEKAGLRVDQG